MSKFTYLVLFVVALSFENCYAYTEEEKAAFQAEVTPLIAECSKQHEVAGSEIEAAKKANTADSINPCFIGCVFKKLKVLNDDGLYDVEKGVGKAAGYVKDPAEQAKYIEAGKKCGAVNDEATSDGKAGCERAKLLLACIISNNIPLPL